MTKAERYIAKIVFKNKILKYKGQQYEDFFVAIMCKSNCNFQPIKAYGNIGDQKNDGFDYSTGTYYQVFAPEEITKGKTIYEAVKKLEDDFKGLYENWNDVCPIKVYNYVLNDKYEGAPSPITQMALNLNRQEEYKDVQINIFLAKDLERVFDNLDELHIQDIIGYVPNEEIPIIEFDALAETVSYLMSIENNLSNQGGLVVPDFDEKIEFNGLSQAVSNRLTNGSYQEATLLQYFNENPGIKEILQKKFTSFYLEAKLEIADCEINYADQRFFYILDKASVKNTIPYQTCVLVLMAYYFSGCDIFEEPPSSGGVN